MATTPQTIRQTTHQQLRGARDNLIDLLGFGKTYPITDLKIRDNQLKVPFNSTAKVPIEASQQNVTYRLYNKEGGELNDGEIFEIDGNGNEALLETPPIDKDTTYRIQARKQKYNDLDPVYLNETAEIKVGLDTALSAQFADKTLNANRIVNYAETNVEVIVENSQEGVDYQLVRIAGDRALDELDKLSEIVVGTGNNIPITTHALHEDLVIGILAHKSFSAEEDRSDENALLEARLPLKVRANPALAVTLDKTIAGFNGTVQLGLADTQSGVRYRLFQHAVVDHPRSDKNQTEFVIEIHGVPEIIPTQSLTVAVDGNPNHSEPVRVKRTAVGGEIWRETPAGYDAASDWQTGSGAALTFTLTELTTDSVVIIQAEKTHQDDTRSAVQLEQAALILVQPDLTVPLSGRLPVTTTSPVEVAGPLELSGGQPGVKYYLRYQQNGEELEPPAYFHQYAEGDENTIGIDELRVEVDFAIAPTVSDSAQQTLVLIDLPRPPIAGRLHVRAEKAITGVSADFEQPLIVDRIPTDDTTTT